MKIVITGGTGLIGRAVVERLTKIEEHSLVVLSRRPASVQHPRVTWCQTDLARNVDSLDSLLESANCVIHCAAHLRHQVADDFVASANLNFAFTTTLFNKATQCKVGKLIYLSGLNFLRKPLASVIDETHLIAPDTPYALAKYWGEAALFGITKGSQTTPIALRITSPIPDTVDELPDTVIKKWLTSARQGLPITVFGQGSRKQDYVSTYDIAKAVDQALTSDVGGVINVASGSPISNMDVARLIAARYGVEVLCAGEDPDEGCEWNVSIEKARSAFGYSPTKSSAECIGRLMGAD